MEKLLMKFQLHSFVVTFDTYEKKPFFLEIKNMALNLNIATFDAHPAEDYQTPLCHWTEDVKYCADSLIFPYCVLGMIKAKHDNRENQMDCFTTIFPAVCDYYGCFGLCLGLFTFLRRRELSVRYNITDGCPKACVLSFCCPVCSLAQIHAEMKKRNDYAGGVFLTPPPVQMQLQQQAISSVAGGVAGAFNSFMK
jgi:Cys-rich protein (TIGR01571 family)